MKFIIFSKKSGIKVKNTARREIINIIYLSISKGAAKGFLTIEIIVNKNNVIEMET